jgi:hypothetical protein
MGSINRIIDPRRIGDCSFHTYPLVRSVEPRLTLSSSRPQARSMPIK